MDMLGNMSSEKHEEAGRETTRREAYQIAIMVLSEDPWVLDHSSECGCGSCMVCALRWFREAQVSE